MKKYLLWLILSISGIILLSTNLFHNLLLDYETMVYLGGDNIVIKYDSKESKNNLLAGTLTYIDETGSFGSVAHESTEDIANGRVYIEPVLSVSKSYLYKPGEKNIILDDHDDDGNVLLSNRTGIYGNYVNSYTDRNLINIAMPKDIKRGKAYIYTNISGNAIVPYEIEITFINLLTDNHNISFKVVDDNLISKSGGIIKGMSGSPIVQDGKLIGAVSHMNLRDPEHGYGLLITSMLDNTNEKIR